MDELKGEKNCCTWKETHYERREGFLKGSRNKKISRPKISRARRRLHNQEEKCEFRKYKYIRIKPRKKERKRRSLCCILPLSRNKREEKALLLLLLLFTKITLQKYHSRHSPLPLFFFFVFPPSQPFSPQNQSAALVFPFHQKRLTRNSQIAVSS